MKDATNAEELAEKIVTYLKQSPAMIKIYPLGSLRRRVSTVRDIDIAVATHDPQAVLNHFIHYPNTERVTEKGDRTASIVVSSGRQIDLMTQPPEGFGALLQHFTDSKAHNIPPMRRCLVPSRKFCLTTKRPRNSCDAAVSLGEPNVMVW